MARTRWPMLAAILALTSAVFPARADVSDDVRSKPFAFTETNIRNSAAEPSIALSNRDHVFICGPLGIPGGQFVFHRSADWSAGTSPAFSRDVITDRGGGGDCDVATGPMANGESAVYVSNLQAWASAVRKSVDDGVTFGAGAEDPVEQDRQWLAADPEDPNVVYLGYHDWTISAIVVAKSIDGGATWPIHTIASSDPLLAVQGLRATTPGRVRVDPTNNQRVYIVYSASTIDQRLDGLQKQNAFPGGRQIIVSRSDDAGLTWKPYVAMDFPVGSDVPNLIPWMALDDAGNVFVAAGGTSNEPGGPVNGMFYASSTDRGATWSAIHKVNAGNDAVVFPTVIAGGNGVANFAWLQSDRASADDTTGTWKLMFAQSRDATSASPSYTTVVGPTVHKGDVCTRGILCSVGGDRSLLDFLDMALDSFGYVHLAVYSTEPGTGCTLGPPVSCPPGRTLAAHTLYWRQDAGPSSRSEPDGTVLTRPGPR